VRNGRSLMRLESRMGAFLRGGAMRYTTEGGSQ